MSKTVTAQRLAKTKERIFNWNLEYAAGPPSIGIRRFITQDAELLCDSYERAVALLREVEASTILPWRKILTFLAEYDSTAEAPRWNIHLLASRASLRDSQEHLHAP